MHPSTLQQDENNFQIKISQDGEFAMTFDTANLRIKIYRNTDFPISYIDLENDMKGKKRVNINETIRNTKNEYKNNNVINKKLIKKLETSSSYIEYNVNDDVVINTNGMDDSKSSRRKTIIYCFKINKNYSLDNGYIPTCCSCNYVSGIPKFINNEKIDHSEISNDQDHKVQVIEVYDLAEMKLQK
ncbi:unnamed protein product [Rhizophagus irregularis]|nr:unnamed protein product [Rhizophagus irregularis]